jgi:hypothetical protein
MFGTFTEITGCSTYKEWKTTEYLNRFGNSNHKEIEVLEDPRRDGRARCRFRDAPIGSKKRVVDDDDDDDDDDMFLIIPE